jgi:hypothetical protein
LHDLLLAPFLTTRDLPSLAATATWLRPYRNLLRDIKIKAWRDDVAPAMLAGQRRLHTMYLGASQLLARLTRSLRGEGEASPVVSLRRLILRWEEAPGGAAPEEHERELGAWLAEGGCPLLEELDVSHAALSPAAASHVYQGLAGCPNLRSLKPRASTLGALTAALEQGTCPKLEHLKVDGIKVVYRLAGRLSGALRAFPRPALRDLHLTTLEVSPAFGDALRPGHLRLDYIVLKEAAAVALFEALGEGACPDLKVLSLYSTPLEPQGARALAQAMRWGSLEGLKVFSVSYSICFHEDEGLVVAALTEALGRGACPDLKVLARKGTGLGPQGARELPRPCERGTSRACGC